MKCESENPNCYNFNKNSPMYCDKCIQKEIDKMSNEEVLEMYLEGKEWIEGISYNKEDPIASDMIDKFKKGWFGLINIVLLTRGIEKGD